MKILGVLLLASLGIAAVVWSLAERPLAADPSRQSFDSIEESDRVEALEDRIAELEAGLAQVAEAERRAELLGGADSTPSVALAAAVGQLEDRIAELEDLAILDGSAVDSDARRLDPELVEMFGRSKPPSPEAVALQRDIATDPRRTDEERLAALRWLRNQPPELDPHTPIAGELAHWIESAEDEDTRADIIRQLHGAEVEGLIDPLLQVLDRDPAESVREEAAETLGDYLDHDRVRHALVRAGQRDPSARVRAAAHEAIADGEEDDDEDEEWKRS